MENDIEFGSSIEQKLFMWAESRKEPCLGCIRAYTDVQYEL